ncbi:MAG TPA: ABC transporter permease [Streptosporangiaceae bacterium]|jgi:peptide/nickel transport system permease protein|nr:ABC transporter permease [Streptosporangiaceae bacterium]
MASTEMSTGLDTNLTPGVPTATRGPDRGRETAAKAGMALNRLFSAVRSNRKASAGFILLVLVTILAAVPGLIAHDPPRAEIYGRSLGPSSAHLFGTTVYGQDIFSQFVWGARETLIIAVVSGVLSTALSVTMGVSAAYLGGMADNTLNLITDTLLVFPSFPLLLIIAAYLPNSGVVVLIAILVITGYAYGARQLRAQALSLRSRDYLEAARVRGERRAYIIAVEIIPNMTPLIVAAFLGTAVYNVLFSAGLQFIGFGNPNSVSWGTMLYWAQNNEALAIGQYLWALMPGLGIAILGAAFALLNYAFDEIGNPALRPVRRLRVKRAR